MNRARTRRGNAGFTYLTLMLAIVVLGFVLGAAAEVWHTAMQREKERELLFAGNQFRQAIGLYYASHRKYPHSLEELVKDPLYPSTRRYLRRIYRDPVTGKDDWALVRTADGGIVGVHSISDKRPLKQAGFGAAGNGFDGAVKYSEWVFLFQPRLVAAAPKPAFGANGDKPLW